MAITVSGPLILPENEIICLVRRTQGSSGLSYACSLRMVWRFQPPRWSFRCGSSLYTMSYREIPAPIWSRVILPFFMTTWWHIFPGKMKANGRFFTGRKLPGFPYRLTPQIYGELILITEYKVFPYALYRINRYALIRTASVCHRQQTFQYFFWSPEMSIELPAISISLWKW